jgi:DsbC/DsbD-like thiol-disulfide interchange protein
MLAKHRRRVWPISDVDMPICAPMTTRRRRAWLITLAVGVLTSRNALPADAVLEAQARTERLTLRMLAENSVVAPGKPVSILLEQKIIPGWHTYWRNPGDSGRPTAIDWKLPPKATADPIQWPVPERIAVGPLANYGYVEHVGLISDLHVPTDWPAGKMFPIVANVTWFVCSDICIPERHKFSLNLPSATTVTRASGVASLFADARATQPAPSEWWNHLSSEGGSTVFSVSMPEAEARMVSNAQVFPNDWGVIDHAGKQTFSVEHGILKIRAPRGDLPVPPAFSGILVLDENGAGGARHLALRFDRRASAVKSTPAP